MSTAFPDPLNLRAWSPDELCDAGFDHAYFTVTTPFRYISKQYGEILVPAGLVTDFASIPRIAWRVINPDDPRIEFPSVVHDYLYGALGSLPDRVLTRNSADDILSEAMGVCGASKLIRWAVHRAVSFFGSSHWKS